MNGTHEGVSGYTISTSFYELMGDQRTPKFWGVTYSTNQGLHYRQFKKDCGQCFFFNMQGEDKKKIAIDCIQ